MKVKAVGGPADGQEFDVKDGIDFLVVPVMPTPYPEIDESDVLNLKAIVGWDNYGPVWHKHVRQARYKIDGEFAYYEEQKGSA